MVAPFVTSSLDPPWLERGGGKIKRGADRHYPLMKLDDIHRTIFTSPVWTPADDAHMYLWVTNNFLPQGLELMRRLGFRYVTNTAWVKMADEWSAAAAALHSPNEKAAALLQIGLGQYQRGAHELLLFGVRGKAMVPEPRDRLPTVVFAPRGRHSEKPVVFYDRIERASPGPYLEVFARSEREGWTSWGLEV